MDPSLGRSHLPDFDNLALNRRTLYTFQNISALVFDFDGTLVTGSNEGYVRSYHQAALAVGCTLSLDVVRERVLERWGASSRIELSGVLREHLELVDDALVHYERSIRDLCFSQAVSPVPHAAEALAALRLKGVKTAVISGMPADLLLRFSEAFGFGFAPSDLVSTADTDLPERQKHTGYHLKLMLGSKGWDRETVAVVGDAPADLQMAESGGTRSIAVLTGWFTEEAAKRAEVDLILPSVAELPHICRS